MLWICYTYRQQPFLQMFSFEDCQKSNIWSVKSDSITNENVVSTFYDLIAYIPLMTINHNSLQVIEIGFVFMLFIFFRKIMRFKELIHFSCNNHIEILTFCIHIPFECWHMIWPSSKMSGLEKRFSNVTHVFYGLLAFEKTFDI